MNLLGTATGRRFVFAALYFSEGAPIGFLWWALPTQLRAQGVPVAEIATLVSLIAVPWAAKFLWAPLIDISRHRGGSIRIWIAAAQTVMGAALLPLLFLDVTASFPLCAVFLVLHAVAASTQDAAIDTLCIATVAGPERGEINGWMQTGMLTGRALFGGGTLLLALTLGLNGTIMLVTGTIWLISLLLTLIREPAAQMKDARGILPAFISHLRTGVFTRTALWGLGFALLAGTGFEALGSLAGPYMVDRGVATETVGLFFALPSVLAMALGGLLGGFVSDRVGRFRAVAWFLGVNVTAICGVGAGDIAGVWSPSLLPVGMTLFYFTIGLFVSSSYALFMDIANVDLGATQFTLFMAATNACESGAAFTAGLLVPSVGYGTAMLLLAGVSLLTLPLITALRRSAASQ